MSMAAQCLYVALGGAVGAVGRYLMGIAPFFPKISFPLPTLLINLIGAFAIGLIAQLAAQKGLQNENLILFLKLCINYNKFIYYLIFLLIFLIFYNNPKLSVLLSNHYLLYAYLFLISKYLHIS